MKTVLLVLVIGIFCAPAVPTCSGQTAAPPGQPAAEKNQPPEELVRQYAEIWNTGNFDLINAIFKFPAIMVSRGQITPLDAGKLKRVITAWRRSIPDLNFKINDTVVQGDKVAARLTFTGTYKERLFANTADPKDHPRNIRATAMWMFDLRDGKITRVWEEYDEIRMHYEMGGFWRSNQELEAAAKADAKTAAPAPQSAPSPSPSPKP
ncbi:MAG: ester cyclase [Terriglobales bacterium]